jgi:hypothetical protein
MALMLENPTISFFPHWHHHGAKVHKAFLQNLLAIHQSSRNSSVDAILQM